MRVKDCKGCRYCQRKVWSSSYKPANYHCVGVSHAYHYCEFNKARCLEVKFCSSFDDGNDATDAYLEHMDIYG